ncbi:hypothetical protein DFA_04119 [Cavenderia fasciculata]|uniref:Uncharacterized protein n=1 Tax=Cavenderia fasciculata TaxID=261658 RepID=F4Q1C3_CACFS|nr:uncharacterized protein DFA_04119 [Cavenderia fasciculata]EGG18624.1 hypothetical protein DFA_04119 [Cavenderia fasciculata]|eukprot:XP_004366528.1 hypothetical protein DFA_04119 [Cavenderia fasciculata]
MGNAKWSDLETSELISTIDKIKKDNPDKLLTQPQIAAEIKKYELFARFTEPQVLNKISNTYRLGVPDPDTVSRLQKKQKYSGVYADSQMPPMSPNSATSIQQTDDLDPIISRHSNYQHFATINRNSNISKSLQQTDISTPSSATHTPTPVSTTTATASTPTRNNVTTTPIKPSPFVNPYESIKSPTPSEVPIMTNTPTFSTQTPAPVPTTSPTVSSNHIAMPDKDDTIDSLNPNNNNSMFISFYGQGNETLTIYLPLCMGETFKHTITSSGDIIVQVFRSDFCCDFTKTKRLPHPMAGTYRAYFKRPLDDGIPVLATNKAYREMYLQEMCGFTFKREIKEISEEVEL